MLAWPLNGSEAVGDLVLTQTSLHWDQWKETGRRLGKIHLVWYAFQKVHKYNSQTQLRWEGRYLLCSSGSSKNLLLIYLIHVADRLIDAHLAHPLQGVESTGHQTGESDANKVQGLQERTREWERESFGWSHTASFLGDGRQSNGCEDKCAPRTRLKCSWWSTKKMSLMVVKSHGTSSDTSHRFFSFFLSLFRRPENGLLLCSLVFLSNHWKHWYIRS